MPPTLPQVSQLDGKTKWGLLSGARRVWAFLGQSPKLKEKRAAVKSKLELRQGKNINR